MTYVNKAYGSSLDCSAFFASALLEKVKQTISEKGTSEADYVTSDDTTTMMMMMMKISRGPKPICNLNHGPLFLMS
jgi:hypothetical protein